MITCVREGCLEIEQITHANGKSDSNVLFISISCRNGYRRRAMSILAKLSYCCFIYRRKTINTELKPTLHKLTAILIFNDTVEEGTSVVSALNFAAKGQVIHAIDTFIELRSRITDKDFRRITAKNRAFRGLTSPNVKNHFVVNCSSRMKKNNSNRLRQVKNILIDTSMSF